MVFRQRNSQRFQMDLSATDARRAAPAAPSQAAASSAAAPDREPNGSISPITVSYRHKQGANVLFYEGHVTWMPKQDVHSDDPIQNAKIWNIIE